HHRADERADEPFLPGVVAEGHDRRRRPAVGHLAPALAQDPDAAQGANALRPRALRGRLVRSHDRLHLAGPVADELLQPLVLFLRVRLHRFLLSGGWDTAERVSNPGTNVEVSRQKVEASSRGRLLALVDGSAGQDRGYGERAWGKARVVCSSNIM